MKTRLLICGLLLSANAAAERVSLERVESEPGISPEVMRREVTPLLPQLERCVDPRPDPTGPDDLAEIRIHVLSPKEIGLRQARAELPGRVTEVDSKVTGALKEDCVRELLRQWKHPTSAWGNTVDSTWHMRVWVDHERRGRERALELQALEGYCHAFEQELARGEDESHATLRALRTYVEAQRGSLPHWRIFEHGEELTALELGEAVCQVAKDSFALNGYCPLLRQWVMQKLDERQQRPPTREHP